MSAERVSRLRVAKRVAWMFFGFFLALFVIGGVFVGGVLGLMWLAIRYPNAAMQSLEWILSLCLCVGVVSGVVSARRAALGIWREAVEAESRSVAGDPR